MKKIYYIALSFLFMFQEAVAQIEIDIKSTVSAGVPIAVVPFAGAELLPQEIHKIIINDLRISGKFDPIDQSMFLSLPSREEQVQYKDWRVLGAELLAIGEVVPNGEENLITFLLYDVAQQRRVGGYRYSVKSGQLREMSHRISDYIFEKRTGIKGSFTSKIAFIKRVGYQSELQVADWDGYGAKTVVSSSEPIMSPAWAPDSKSIAFVTFNKGRSIIKEVMLESGAVKTLVSSSRGINSAPAWSPSGDKLAYSSSRSGNADIYILDKLSKLSKKITSHWGIDTEPTWSSDGASLLFTSGRSGKPNVYQVSAFGGDVQRVTYTGEESGDASVSPNGSTMVAVQDGGVTVLTKTGQLVRTLHSSGYDESPSFSAKLMVSSVDGRAIQALDLLTGDVRDSAWSKN